MSQYFPKPYRTFAGNINIRVDLSNYATKADLKNALGVDISKLAAKSDLVSLKVEVDETDTDKLKTVPVDLSKISNVVDNGVDKKKVQDELVIKVNNIDTNGFILKSKYTADKPNLEKESCDADRKVPDTSELVKKTKISEIEITKISEIEIKIPSISGLATASALSAVENKIA